VLGARQSAAARSHLYSLTLQGACLKTVNQTAPTKNISLVSLWSSTLESVACTVSNFAHKALHQVLPTASNLVRWKRISDPTCPLCKSGKQANKHVVSNCLSPVALARYTTRHDDVPRVLINWLKTVISEQQHLWY